MGRTKAHRIGGALNKHGILPPYLTIKQFKKMYSLNKANKGELWKQFEYWYNGLLDILTIYDCIINLCVSYGRHNKTNYNQLCEIKSVSKSKKLELNIYAMGKIKKQNKQPLRKCKLTKIEKNKNKIK